MRKFGFAAILGSKSCVLRFGSDNVHKIIMSTLGFSVSGDNSTAGVRGMHLQSIFQVAALGIFNTQIDYHFEVSIARRTRRGNVYLNAPCISDDFLLRSGDDLSTEDVGGTLWRGALFPFFSDFDIV